MARSTDGRCVLRAQVARELGSLGATADEVAERLAAAGVRGRPGNASDCALAVYLSAVVASDPQVRAVYVAPERVLLKLDQRRWWPWIGVAMSKPLRSFVARFDRSAYPTLVRSDAAADAEPTASTAPGWPAASAAQ
jgi:hypothetical protein